MRHIRSTVEGSGEDGGDTTHSCHLQEVRLQLSEEGTTPMGLMTFIWIPRPESGRDCLTCAMILFTAEGLGQEGGGAAHFHEIWSN